MTTSTNGSASGSTVERSANSNPLTAELASQIRPDRYKKNGQDPELQAPNQDNTVLKEADYTMLSELGEDPER